MPNSSTPSPNMPTTPNSVFTLNCNLAEAYSNSYVDVNYCTAYWQKHWSQTKAAQWTGLSPDQQASLLIQACRTLETIRFTVVSRLRDDYPLLYDRRTGMFVQLNDQLLPIKYYYYQRLQFPRNLDRDIITGELYVPEPVCMAQCEQAVYILNFDDTSIANRLQGVTEDITTVGNIHLRQNLVTGGSSFAPAALELARPYMLTTSYEVRRQ